MYEHAYHMDYGAAAGAYVDAFMDNVDWAKVYERYQKAVHDASESFSATQDDLAQATLVDVRRAGVFEQATNLVPGATWHDPAQVALWSREFPLTVRSSSTASTATRWAAQRRFAYVPPGSMRLPAWWHRRLASRRAAP